MRIKEQEGRNENTIREAVATQHYMLGERETSVLIRVFRIGTFLFGSLGLDINLVYFSTNINLNNQISYNE